MSTQDVLASNELHTIDESKPYASYVKTILGQVGVNVWDRFTNQPAYAILRGDPRRKEESAIVDVWTQKEDAFFKRNNRSHFEKGILVSYTRPESVEAEAAIEQFSDEQLREIVNSKFLSLTNRLNKITSIPVLFRMKNIAEDEEKSAKIINVIEARISEIQLAEYEPKSETKEE